MFSFFANVPATATLKWEPTQKRLVEIDAEIAKATGWGAKLTALLEERRAILRNLGYVK